MQERVKGEKMKPIIGITANYSTLDFHGISTKIGVAQQEWQLLANDYIYAIENAGGIPLILPVLSEKEDIKEILGKLDGLILSGGSDIDPKYYNQYPQEGLGGIMPKRDSYETVLARTAVHETELPILGICRGIQMLTIATDGQLNQDMKFQKATPFKHTCIESPKYHPIHDVIIEENSIFKKIFGANKIGVNSYHHQSIDEVGNGFRVTMTADDKTIEGIEMTGDRFILGVQWHPEMMVEHDSYYLKLFKAFIESSKNRGKNG